MAVVACPVGTYVVQDAAVRLEPAVDITRVVLNGQLLGLVALLTIRRMLLRGRH